MMRGGRAQPVLFVGLGLDLSSSRTSFVVLGKLLSLTGFGNVARTHRIAVRITQLLRKVLPTQLTPSSNHPYSTEVIPGKR